MSRLNSFMKNISGLSRFMINFNSLILFPARALPLFHDIILILLLPLPFFDFMFLFIFKLSDFRNILI